MAQMIEQTQELRADAKARLDAIDALCRELSMTLESEPDVVHAYLARQAMSISMGAQEWAESKARRARR